jgi:type 1 glutamine amidotransferase
MNSLMSSIKNLATRLASPLRTVPVISLILALLSTSAIGAAQPKKIVLIAGPITGHGKGVHEYEKDIILIKHLLDNSSNLKGLKTEVHFQGWPKDPTTLDDADLIVFNSDGSNNDEIAHPLYVERRIEILEKQMKRGCGLVQLHWATFNPSRFHERITEWVGGYFDYEKGTGPKKWFSAIKTYEGPAKLGQPDHPILRGVKPFSLKEEFYYNIRFRANDERVKPIVLTRPPGESRDHTVGWAISRKDGGRGFGFTGGHFFENWKKPDYRKFMLNALVWAAGAEVPAGGVESIMEEPIRALIVTGNNHPAHDWRKVTAALIGVLEQDPRVVAHVTEEPNDLAKIKRDDYDLVVINYCNWDRPGLNDEAKKGFVNFLKSGGGLSIVHYANGAFTPTIPATNSVWPEYYAKIVRRYWLHGQGNSGHDSFGGFQVAITDEKHPVTSGLAPFTTNDELYFRQEGKEPIKPLVTAHSQVTGNDEPMAWVYQYEKARVFQTVLGHSDESVRNAGALIRRGSVWTAGRKNLGFDPSTETTKNLLFRSGSQWSPAESEKRAGKKTAATKPAKPVSKEPQVAGRFGKGLNASVTPLRVAGNPTYAQRPFSVECWAKLPNKSRYNILVANHAKASAAHWEIFANNGSGLFTAYIPGYTPDHVRSKTNICDDKWHHLAMVHDADRVRLFVDGKQVADQKVEFNDGKTGPGPLTIGGLVSGGINCEGAIDDVRISKGPREFTSVPDAPLKADAQTIGLWSFDEVQFKQQFKDLSKTASPALFGAVAQRLKKAQGSATKSWKVAGTGEADDPTRQTDADWHDDRWQKMDVGPFLGGAINAGPKKANKAIAVKLVGGKGGVCFDTEALRYSAGWTGGFLKMESRRYGLAIPPAADGKIQFHTDRMPGWAKAGSFDDPREKSRGSLPKDWAHYKGMYRHDQDVVFKYTVGDVLVHDSPSLLNYDGGASSYPGRLTGLGRSLKIGPSTTGLKVLIAELPKGFRRINSISHGRVKGEPTASLATFSNGKQKIVCGVFGQRDVTVSAIENRWITASIPAGKSDRTIQLTHWFPHAADLVSEPHGLIVLANFKPKAFALASTQGGPSLWPEVLTVKGARGKPKNGFATETIPVPFKNPWNALMFTSGVDFFDNGDAAVCTVHGDVWRVSGIDDDLNEIKWKRYATGLHQPLGLKMVDNKVHVLERDQITILHDLNGDNEADFYENFNNDVVSGGGGHAFATSLETDLEGNFWFMKCAEDTPQGGAIMRVSKDGSKLEVIATGFRNPNGMGVSPTGVVTAGDQQGTWVPETRLDIIQKGGFYGYMPMHKRDIAPTDFDPPLIWIPRPVDNSAGGQTWVPKGAWGPLSGQMLHLSYGRCTFMAILRDESNAGMNGAAVQLPGRFLSGVMRARFNPHDGHLYLTGLRGWQTAAIHDGCLQRVRYTGEKLYLPVAFNVHANGVKLTFSQPLDKELAEDVESYGVEQWNYKWTKNYGSPDFKPSDSDEQGRDPVSVKSATLLKDGKSVFLNLGKVDSVHAMAINYNLDAKDGKLTRGSLYLTVNRVGPRQ